MKNALWRYHGFLTRNKARITKIEKLIKITLELSVGACARQAKAAK